MSNRGARLDMRLCGLYTLRMATIIIHNEYWDERTGRDILMQAAKAADGLYTPESIHVYNPNILTERGDEWGECSIWWSVNIPTSDESTMRNTMYAIVDAIRDAGIRVKDAGILPDEYARCDYDTMSAALFDPILTDDMA